MFFCRQHAMQLFHHKFIHAKHKQTMSQYHTPQDIHMMSPEYQGSALSTQGLVISATSSMLGAVSASLTEGSLAADHYEYPEYDISKVSEIKNVSLEADNQASMHKILELRGLERRIVQLLETAGQAIHIITGDDDEVKNGDETLEDGTEQTKRALLEKQKVKASTFAPSTLSSQAKQRELIEEHAESKSQEFETYAKSYTTLVNEIQVGLRKHFHYLTKAGIASSHVPFKNVLYGEEKELETWLDAVDVLNEGTADLISSIQNNVLHSAPTSTST